MKNELSLRDLREMMARIESRQEAIVRRHETLAERMAEIEEAIRRIEHGESELKRATGGKTAAHSPKRRGRKPANPRIEEAAEETAEAPETERIPVPDHETALIAEPVKKRRGRPPKARPEQQLETQHEIAEQAAVAQDAPDGQPVKKRRGRPPKARPEQTPDALPEVADQAAIQAEAPVLDDQSTDAPKKRRGRKPKNEQALTEALETSSNPAEARVEDESEPSSSYAPVDENTMNDLQAILTRALESAGKPLKFDELVTAAQAEGFAAENRGELVQECILKGPFRETVNGVIIQPPKEPSTPLADLLQ